MHHVAFFANGLAAMRAQIEVHGVEFRERTLADKHLIVVKDPDGIEIEITFSLEELKSGS
jgi:hypothetical protein